MKARFNLLPASCVLFILVYADAVPSQTPPQLEGNLIIGTQAIGGPYQFTDKPYLQEVAEVVASMGSNLIKFVASTRYAGKPYYLDAMDEIRSLKDLLGVHPVYRNVLSMDFKYYHFWAREFGQADWRDGLDSDECSILYREFRELAEFLLTACNGTGKQFFIGHWEGDWLLLEERNADLDPDPVRIAGFIQYLQGRQQAINDARESITGPDVGIFHYTKVNPVRKGLDGSRPTLTNSVLPHVDIDYVSYSSYDTIKLPDMDQAVREALDHIEDNMIRRPGWQGKRVFAGECAIHAGLVDYDPVEHDRRNREVLSAFIEWGCPFVLYWQVYCNEPNPRHPSGYKGFWLIDPDGRKVPLYHTLEKYWKAAKSHILQVKLLTGTEPSFDQMREFALNYLAPDS